MYYYGNNGYGGGYGATPGFVGTTYGYGGGGAIWIVLFILLIIIIGAGWGFNSGGCGGCCNG